MEKTAKMVKTLKPFPLKNFRKNVVVKTYRFVVESLVEEMDTFELLYVDAESLDVARTKAKELAEMLGYKTEPMFVDIPDIPKETT